MLNSHQPIVIEMLNDSYSDFTAISEQLGNMKEQFNIEVYSLNEDMTMKQLRATDFADIKETFIEEISIDINENLIDYYSLDEIIHNILSTGTATKKELRKLITDYKEK